MTNAAFAVYTDNVEIMTGIWEAFEEHFKEQIRDICPGIHFDNDIGRPERLILENLCDKRLFCDFAMFREYGKITFGFQIHGMQEGQIFNVAGREIFFDQGGHGYLSLENEDEAFSIVGNDHRSQEMLSSVLESTIHAALFTPHQYMASQRDEQSANHEHLMDSLLQEV